MIKRFKLLILIAVLGIATLSCTDEKGALRILENEGYTNIVLTGYDAYGCSDSDDFSTGFTATNSHGKQVVGVVCSGMCKGYTIRFH